MQYVTGLRVLHKNRQINVLRFPARVEVEALYAVQIAVVIEFHRADQAAHDEIVPESFSLVLARTDRGRQVHFIQRKVNLGGSLDGVVCYIDFDSSDERRTAAAYLETSPVS